MIERISSTGLAPGLEGPTNVQAQSPTAESIDIGKRFEQMLWAEMLSHSGLEEALTLNGGEAASAFSRYVVESIAADIAEKHPLGLSSPVEPQTEGDEQ